MLKNNESIHILSVFILYLIYLNFTKKRLQLFKLHWNILLCSLKNDPLPYIFLRGSLCMLFEFIYLYSASFTCHSVCVNVCPVYCTVCIRALFACLTSYLPCLNTEPALGPKRRPLSAHPSVTTLQPVEERPTSLLPIPTLCPTERGLGCRDDGEGATGQSCSTLTPSVGADTRQLLRTPSGQQRTWLHCQSVLLCHNMNSLNN